MRRVASDGEGGDEADTEEGTLLQSTLLNLGDSSGQLRQLEEYMVRHVGLAAEAGGLKHASTALMWRMLEITRRKRQLLQAVEARTEALEAEAARGPEMLREVVAGSLERPPELMKLEVFIASVTHRGNLATASRADFGQFASTFRLPPDHEALERLRRLRGEGALWWVRACLQEAEKGTAGFVALKAMLDVAVRAGLDRDHPLLFRAKRALLDRVADWALEQALLARQRPDAAGATSAEDAVESAVREGVPEADPRIRQALAPPTTTGAAAAGATESAAWEAYDCWEGDLDWRDTWTPKQVDWCCQHSGFGCMEAGEPVTCVARRAGDEAGWSSQRRSWCCTHEAIGCPRTTDTSTPTPSSTGLRSTLTTSRETTTTLNLALTSTTSEGPAEEDASCFEANVAYEPLDMLGATVTVERSAEDCQARCRRFTGCESFSFWQPGRHCHLQDASARRQGLMLQFVAGRPLCGDRARPSAPEARQAMRCFEQASYWPAMGGPVSLAAEGGSSMDLRDVAKLCQQLCHDTSGCAHFFVQRGPRRMCHLAGAGAHRVAAVGAIAGPRSCAELGLGLGLQGKARRGAPRFAAAPGANAAELAVASLAAVAACAGVCVAATARRAASRWRTHEYTALDLDLDLDAAAEGDPIL